MNYTSAAIGVIGAVSVVTWITTGRRNFTGPKTDMADGQSTSDKDETSSETEKLVKMCAYGTICVL